MQGQVQGSVPSVECSGFRVQDLGCRVRVPSLEFRVSEFRVKMV